MWTSVLSIYTTEKSLLLLLKLIPFLYFCHDLGFVQSHCITMILQPEASMHISLFVPIVFRG